MFRCCSTPVDGGAAAACGGRAVADDRMAQDWHPPSRDPPMVQPSGGRGLASSLFSLLIVSSQSRSGRRQQGTRTLSALIFFLD